MINYINFLLSKTGEKLFTKKKSSFDFECKDPNCPHCLEDIAQMQDEDTLKEYHIVDTNEMVDQVPDVRKMVEDDNYLTPVDWLMDRIKWIHRETYDYLIKEGQYDVAKRTENAIFNKANELQSSQTEISDKDIEKQAFKFAQEESYGEFSGDLWKGYVFGAKRMRDQLKQL